MYITVDTKNAVIKIYNEFNINRTSACMECIENKFYDHWHISQQRSNIGIVLQSV
jgi:hypothetical protein